MELENINGLIKCGDIALPMVAITNLNELINHQAGEDMFKAIAELLLLKTMLLVGAEKYEITEIEFYYKDSNHDDVNIHGCEEQAQSNTFYIHKIGRGGIDVTFGNEASQGGILLRE